MPQKVSQLWSLDAIPNFGQWPSILVNFGFEKQVRCKKQYVEELPKITKEELVCFRNVVDPMIRWGVQAALMLHRVACPHPVQIQTCSLNKEKEKVRTGLKKERFIKRRREKDQPRWRRRNNRFIILSPKGSVLCPRADESEADPWMTSASDSSFYSTTWIQELLIF